MTGDTSKRLTFRSVLTGVLVSSPSHESSSVVKPNDICVISLRLMRARTSLAHVVSGGVMATFRPLSSSSSVNVPFLVLPSTIEGSWLKRALTSAVLIVSLKAPGATISRKPMKPRGRDLRLKTAAYPDIVGESSPSTRSSISSGISYVRSSLSMCPPVKAKEATVSSCLRFRSAYSIVRGWWGYMAATLLARATATLTSRTCPHPTSLEFLLVDTSLDSHWLSLVHDDSDFSVWILA